MPTFNQRRVRGDLARVRTGQVPDCMTSVTVQMIGNTRCIQAWTGWVTDIGDAGTGLAPPDCPAPVHAPAPAIATPAGSRPTGPARHCPAPTPGRLGGDPCVVGV